MWEDLSKGTVVFASTSVWEGTGPSALASEASLYVPYTPFKLQPPHWSSEPVSPVCLYVGPLRGTAWDSPSHWSPSATTSAGFYSQKLWGLPFLALEPCA